MASKVWLRKRVDPGALGREVTAADADLILTGDCDVFKPDGSLLLSLRRGVLSKEAMDAAWPLLYRSKDHVSLNRGIAAGGERQPYVKADGTLSNTHVAEPTHSIVLGYYDRYPRMPYCRQTALVAEHLNEWEDTQPFLREIAEVYAKTAPDRYRAQMAKAAETSKDFVITGTPWTTLTVNHNWQTRLHTDKGDWIGEGKGLGVITAITRGDFSGGTLIYPAYRIGADLRSGDVLFMDSHEAHANTALVGDPETFDRVSLVLYYRSKMAECGTAAEELERAKNRDLLLDA